MHERVALPLEPQAPSAGRRHRRCRRASASAPSIDAARARGAARSSASRASRRRRSAARGRCAAARCAPTKASSRGAALGEGQRAQVLGALEQQVVSADAGRDIPPASSASTRLAVQPLLQVGEGRDVAVADHQQFAIEHGVGTAAPRRSRGRRAEMSSPVRENSGAGRPPGDQLDADAVPFPFGARSRRGRARRNRPSSSACASITGRKPGASRGSGVSAAAFQPGEQRQVGRGERRARPPRSPATAWPDALRQRALGEPAGDADAQAAGDQLEQRPAAGGIEACPASRRSAPAARTCGVSVERSTTSASAGGGAFAPCRAAARSAPRSRRGRRHSRRLSAKQLRIDPRRRPGRGCSAGLAAAKTSSPVSAASAQPRSGSGVVREVVAQQRQLGVARGGEDQPLQQRGEGGALMPRPRLAVVLLLASPTRSAPGRGCRAAPAHAPAPPRGHG